MCLSYERKKRGKKKERDRDGHGLFLFHLHLKKKKGRRERKEKGGGKKEMPSFRFLLEQKKKEKKDEKKRGRERDRLLYFFFPRKQTKGEEKGRRNTPSLLSLLEREGRKREKTASPRGEMGSFDVYQPPEKRKKKKKGKHRAHLGLAFSLIRHGKGGKKGERKGGRRKKREVCIGPKALLYSGEREKKKGEKKENGQKNHRLFFLLPRKRKESPARPSSSRLGKREGRGGKTGSRHVLRLRREKGEGRLRHAITF